MWTFQLVPDFLETSLSSDQRSVSAPPAGELTATVPTNGFGLFLRTGTSAPRPPFTSLVFSQQADERYRKNVQGSPQSAPQTKPQQPPVPPRSESSYPNGNSASEAPAMHRPVEPQVSVVGSG